MLTSAWHVEEWEHFFKPFILWWSLAVVQAHIYLPLPLLRCGKLHGCVSKYMFTKIRNWSIWESEHLDVCHVSAACSSAGEVEWGKECPSEGWLTEPGERETNVYVISWLSPDPAAVTEIRRRASAGKWKGMGLLHSYSSLVFWHVDSANVTDMTHWCWMIFPQSVVLVVRKQVVMRIFVYMDINLSASVQTWFVWHVCYCISFVSISENWDVLLL